MMKTKPVRVFTNGCFDLLHVGHIRHLEASRQLGDFLIVGLNSDASVRRLKGPERPIVNMRNRRETLLALSCVDQVVVFDEATPMEAIKAIKPDVLTKGGDYNPDNIVGADFVRGYGGQVVVTTFEQGLSSSQMIEQAANTRGR